MKVCIKCNTNKPLTEFNIKWKAKDQLSPRCKKCTSDDYHLKKYGKIPTDIIPVLEGEVWKPIKGYEKSYAISNLGRIKKLIGQYNTNKEKISTARVSTEEYMSVTLSNKKHYIHRLIAEAFIPNPHNKPFVNHKNGNKKDYRIENLEWCTAQENADHASQTHLLRQGERHPLSKLTEKEVREVLENYTENRKCSYSSIAKKYNVATGAIYKIINNYSWKHIKR